MVTTIPILLLFLRCLIRPESVHLVWQSIILLGDTVGKFGLGGIWLFFFFVKNGEREMGLQ